MASPDLILLDILMPGLDGFATSRCLKEKINTCDIPIIFLTALSETVNKIKGFEAGGIDYITKPIEQREVLARIQTHLSLQKMRQHLLTQNKTLQKEVQTRLQVEDKLKKRTEQLEQTLKYRESLRRIQEKIRDSLDESQILQRATQELVELLAVEGCQLELYDPDKKTVTIFYEYSNGLSTFKGICRRLEDFPELYRQLLQKTPLQLSSNLNSFSSPQDNFTNLVCPIFENHSKKGILGNLWLSRSPEQIFTELEIQLVQQVANQCAIAIRQARLYEAAQQQVQELEKLNRLKNDFLKTISHELRSPMSSLQLSVQTIEKLLEQECKERSPLFTKVLNIFRQACQRQKQLVDDLLSLCYIDAKAEVLVNEWIDLQIWIPEIVQLFSEQARIQKQHLIVDLPPQLPHLKSDISTLERIVRELLNNACKYTPSGEKIIISAEADSQKIILSITNTGVEIPSKEQELIFAQFYRIPNNDPWQHGGTGLGLTLVKKLVEILNISIELISKNHQTTFSLKFPRE